MDKNIHSIIERITGAVFLIFLGCILLLNSTGALPWSIWGNVFMTFFRIWPIFLIFAGFQIIFSSNKIAKSVFDIAWTILIIGIFSLSILASIGKITLPEWTNSIGWNLSFTNANSVTQTQELKFEDYQDVSTLAYEINVQAGEFNLSSTDSSNAYLTTKAEYKENIGTPKSVVDQTGSDVLIKFYQEFEGIAFGASNFKYDLTLDSNDKPTKIDAQVTAGDLKADLSSLKLTDLKFLMTAGDARIKVGNDVKDINIKVTAGKLTLLVPQSYRLEIDANSTAGDIDVDGKEINSGSTVINSTGEKTLKLDLTQTAGSIEIERI